MPTEPHPPPPAPERVASYRVETTPCILCASADAEPLIESQTQMSAEKDCRFTFVRCRACGLIYLSPRVAAQDVGRFYDPSYLPHRGESAWGKYAPLVRRGQAGADRAKVKLVRRACPLGPASAALDVGCGKPTFLELLRTTTGARAVGLDFSDQGWSADPARWAAAGVELHHGELRDADLPGPFDLVTLWHALEHDYAPLETLRRLRSLTKPGGALVVEVPNYASLTRRLHGPHWAGFHTPRHTAVYTPTTLRALLERAGWRVERQVAHGTLDPYVLWWLGRQERRGRALHVDLENRFVGFVLKKLALLPVTALRRWISLGIQTAVARRVD